MSAVFDTAAVLLVLAAGFGWLNYRFLRLPTAIGLVVIALAASLGLLALDALLPGWALVDTLQLEFAEIDFSETLMTGMLSFLLFAGALHVDLTGLQARKWAIGSLATLGVLLSTAIVGILSWLAFAAVGVDLPLIYCIVFGALISPTDPVAVLGILKTAKVPPSLEAKIAGESLFNDGVGVVVFLIIAGIATGVPGHGGEDLSALGVIGLFLQEAVGGIVLGLGTGLLAFWVLRGVDEHNLEVIVTLALVTGTYQAAQALHLSGPIAVVVAGLLIGNQGTRLAMSENTRLHLTSFWTLVDEILNAVLFLLIGLEVLVLRFDANLALAGALAIPIVLLARFSAVGVPIRLLGMFREFSRGAVRILTWGGLRGGISVALALSLPPSAEREIILGATYAVVVFSIIVQGLTIAPLVRRLTPSADDLDAHGG